MAVVTQAERPQPLPGPGAREGRGEQSRAEELPARGKRSQGEPSAVGMAGSSHPWVSKMRSDLVQLKAHPKPSSELLEKAKFAAAAAVTFVTVSVCPAVGGP